MLHANIQNIGVETQREVVKEEKRQRVDNQPYGSWLENMMKRLYTEHPYNWVPIGSMDHLNAAQLDEFMAFYKKFYVPNNATLSIAGDIDVEKPKSLLQRTSQRFLAARMSSNLQLRNQPWAVKRLPRFTTTSSCRQS